MAVPNGAERMDTITMSEMTGRADLPLNRYIYGYASVAGVLLLIVVSEWLRLSSLLSWQVVALIGAAAVAGVVALTVRIGSNRISFGWGEATIVLGLVLLDPSVLIVCAVIGKLIAELALRVPPLKMLFNLSKQTVAVAVGAWAGSTFAGDQIGRFSVTGTVGLVVGAAVFVLVADVSVAIAVGLASGAPATQVLVKGWQVRLVAVIGNVAAGLATVWVLSLNMRMLIAVPPLVLCLHLLYAIRLRTRAERDAWQRLADATDRLNDVELDRVLRTAVNTATEIFSADEVEIEVRLGDGPPGLVRGDASEVTFAGRVTDAPPAYGVTIAARLTNPTRYRARVTTSELDLLDHRYALIPDRPLPALEAPGALDTLDGEPGLGELRLRFRGKIRLNERERYVLQTFAAALSTALRNAYAFAETQRLAERHAHAATHDALTGLPNRRHLLERGEEVLSARPVRGVHALLLIDLDHFKEVNDTLGHSAGDEVLTVVGRRLAAAAGEKDVVARLGGDEFAVLFVGLAAPALATHRARQLVAALDPPLETDGLRIHVSASGGVATAPAQGGIRELLRRADVAMYQAKREGQTVATYARSRDTADVGRLALGGDLRAALDERQFTVQYQPIVDLASGEVLAAEALTRWIHPYRGELDPRRFLTSIEQSGMLPAFSRIVLDEALAAAQQWHANGHDVSVAVNVSPRSLLDLSYPELVARRLLAYQVPADRVVLEITETLTLSQLDIVDEVVSQLRELGVRLALDDFGTGYSSLAMLARVPVHELKIDHSFVSAMESSPEAAAVVRATVELGRSLGLLVVAEGVESQQQRGALFEMGCPTGQGHLFSRPMTADRFLGVLARGRRVAPPLSEDAQVIRIPPSRLVRRNRDRL